MIYHALIWRCGGLYGWKTCTRRWPLWLALAAIVVFIAAACFVRCFIDSTDDSALIGGGYSDIYMEDGTQYRLSYAFDERQETRCVVCECVNSATADDSTHVPVLISKYPPDSRGSGLFVGGVKVLPSNGALGVYIYMGHGHLIECVWIHEDPDYDRMKHWTAAEWHEYARCVLIPKSRVENRVHGL